MKNELLQKYRRISISDIEDAERYADSTIAELKTDMNLFQKNMVRNWRRKATKKEIKRLLSPIGRNLLIEMFISARNTVIDYTTPNVK